MRYRFLALLVAVLSLPMLNACSALRSGKLVPAGYEAEKQSWVSKYVPGAQTISNLVPPPSEARSNWDRWYEKRSDPWKVRDEDR
jgi:hypothetical protein